MAELLRNGTNREVQTDWFQIHNAHEKIRRLPEEIETAFALTKGRKTFDLGRDVEVVSVQELSPKIGISAPLGQARLLHDLANIELQAMELAVRTLYEFPEAPREFREELADIALGESRHLSLCLRGIEASDASWGQWRVHMGLWNTVSSEDSLLDRILIVHRYLEGSGLDAGDTILRRLHGQGCKGTRDVVKLIVDEEVGHVLFGSLWYRRIAEMTGVDPERDFSERIGRIEEMAPRRERLAHRLREQAGFSRFEMNILEDLLEARTGRR